MSDTEDGKLDTAAYRLAPEGQGPHAATWADKPHRLVYDLCATIERLRAELAGVVPADIEEQAEQLVSLLIFDSEMATNTSEATEQWRHRIASALSTARSTAFREAAEVARAWPLAETVRVHGDWADHVAKTTIVEMGPKFNSLQQEFELGAFIARALRNTRGRSIADTIAAAIDAKAKEGT